MRFAIFGVTMFGLLRLMLGQTRAYVDPGSGSMLLQVLLGGVAGIGVIISLFWQRIRSILPFGRKDED